MLPKKRRYINYVLYSRIHSHMMIRISNPHSEHLLVFCTSALLPCELKVASFLERLCALVADILACLLARDVVWCRSDAN